MPSSYLAAQISGRPIRGPPLSGPLRKFPRDEIGSALRQLLTGYQKLIKIPDLRHAQMQSRSPNHRS